LAEALERFSAFESFKNSTVAGPALAAHRERRTPKEAK
jgi:hypothetical protein